MTKKNSASAPDAAYDAKTLAKKHRISVDDAAKVIEQHGTDRKAADKAARRIAV